MKAGVHHPWLGLGGRQAAAPADSQVGSRSPAGFPVAPRSPKRKRGPGLQPLLAVVRNSLRILVGQTSAGEASCASRDLPVFAVRLGGWAQGPGAAKACSRRASAPRTGGHLFQADSPGLAGTDVFHSPGPNYSREIGAIAGSPEPRPWTCSLFKLCGRRAREQETSKGSGDGHSRPYRGPGKGGGDEEVGARQLSIPGLGVQVSTKDCAPGRALAAGSPGSGGKTLYGPTQA